MRRIKHFFSNLVDLFQACQEVVYAFMVAHVLWPLGMILYAIALLVVPVLFVLTVVIGAFVLLIMVVFATGQLALAFEVYAVVVTFELFLGFLFLVVALLICDYFDRLNGMY